MKNTKALKLITVILSVALLIGAAFAIAVSAEGEAKSPEIISYNVEYGEKYALMYAVDASTVNSAPVTLNLYAADPATGADIIRSYVAEKSETIKIDGVETEAYVFITDGVAAKNLTQIFYAQATDKSGAKGNVVRYSVIEYMYQRLSGQQKITANQETLYRTVIELASISTQVLINDKTEGTENDVTLASDYSYVYFPYGDGFIGETDGATDGYKAGIYAKGATIYPTVAATATGNYTATIYDDNAQIKGTKVIKNGEALQLDGDMTIITAGGEKPYSPDLTDAAGRLTFDNGEAFSNYKIKFNDDKNQLETNSTSGVYSIVDGTPWGQSSKIFNITLDGVNRTWYAKVMNETAGADAKGIKYELDLMFTTPSTDTTWSFNIVTGNAAATNTCRAQFIVKANGTVQIKDRETNEVTTLDVKTGQWFRLTVEYMNNSTDGIIANWYINEEFVDSTTRGSSDTTAITSIHALWIQTNGVITGNAYMDNIKTQIIK